jgi:hypothetical protein
LDAFGDDELRRMTLAQVSRALRIASTLARSALVGAELPASSGPQTTPLQQQLLNAVKCLYGQPPSPAGAPRPSDGRNAGPWFGWREATEEGCDCSAAGEGRTENSVPAQGGPPQRAGDAPRPGSAAPLPSRGSAAGEGRTENLVLSQGGPPQRAGDAPRASSAAPSPSRGSAADAGRDENPTPSPAGELPSRGSALKTQNSKFKT